MVFLGFCWGTQLSLQHSEASCPETTPVDTNRHDVPSPCCCCSYRLLLFAYFHSCSGQTRVHISQWCNSHKVHVQKQKLSVVSVYRRAVCGLIFAVNIFPSQFSVLVSRHVQLLSVFTETRCLFWLPSHQVTVWMSEHRFDYLDLITLPNNNTNNNTTNNNTFGLCGGWDVSMSLQVSPGDISVT